MKLEYDMDDVYKVNLTHKMLKIVKKIRYSLVVKFEFFMVAHD